MSKIFYYIEPPTIISEKHKTIIVAPYYEYWWLSLNIDYKSHAQITRILMWCENKTNLTDIYDAIHLEWKAAQYDLYKYTTKHLSGKPLCKLHFSTPEIMFEFKKLQQSNPGFFN